MDALDNGQPPTRLIYGSMFTDFIPFSIQIESVNFFKVSIFQHTGKTVFITAGVTALINAAYHDL